MQQEIIFRPIGVVHSPFKEPTGTPIQPSAARETRGIVEILPEYEEGLQDLEGFSHLILLYHCHLARGFTLKVKPFLDDTQRGLFATRAPQLHIREVDIVDGTPLLDIKPYVPQFDTRTDATSGWLEKNMRRLESARDDGRFLT